VHRIGWGISAGGGEGAVQFIPDGFAEDSFAVTVNENDALAFVLQALPEDLPEVIQLKLKHIPFGNSLIAGHQQGLMTATITASGLIRNLCTKPL
jgi:hypothetical protein